MSEKKIPQRRCAGCNTRRNKNELIRIVRTPEGNIILDKTGKVNGRGIYICNDSKCLEKAKKLRRFEKGLEVSIPDEIYDEIYKETESENNL